MAALSPQQANSVGLKRSFAQVAISDPSSSQHHLDCDSNSWTPTPTYLTNPRRTGRSTSSPLIPVRRHPHPPHLRSSSMPVQTSSPSVPVSFPSFMSVYGGDSTIHSRSDEKEIDTTYTFGRPTLTTNISQSSDSHYISGIQHQHCDSVSSAGSTDSSPTTTISTFDSSSMTDTSPSSSPESPSSGMPLSSFKMMMTDGANDCSNNTADGPFTSSIHLSPFTNTDCFATRPESPGRKERNMKNLSLNVAPIEKRRPTTASALETSHPFSAPTSPLSGPLRSARKKPTNLTIRTPGFDKLNFGPALSNATALVPPTPGLKLPLRHFDSSPALASPGLAPMGFGHLRNQSFQSTHSVSACSSDVDSPARRSSHTSEGLHEVREEEEQNYDVPKSQEVPERGYPDGPVRIYDSGLYLYLEPTREEASKFDVVINVASEVKNPFERQGDRSSTVMAVWRNGLEPRRHSIAEPQSAASITSFQSAFEKQPEPQASVTIQPATPITDCKEPEYIHVPWDHASEILGDLPTICSLIDERINQGKSVLVHCQLGVSRSASLVVAYGLYKNRHMDFNGMYTKVKERSRWVGPNMRLIYQLTDFKGMLEKDELPKNPAPKTWFKLGPLASAPEEPVREFKLPLVPASRSRSRSKSKENAGGDASVPRSAPQIRQSSISPRPLPLREAYQPKMPEFPPLAEAQPKNELKITHQSVEADSVMQDVPATPALFSPRAVEFLTNPFSRTLTTNTNMSTTTKGLVSQDPPAARDPRSPPQRGQLPFIRSLNEFLWPRHFKKSKRG